MGADLDHDGRLVTPPFFDSSHDVFVLDRRRGEGEFGGEGSVWGGDGHVEEAFHAFVQETVDYLGPLVDSSREFEAVPCDGACDRVK